VRRFRYPSGGRRLKEHRRVPAGALGVYLASGLRAAVAEVRRARARVIHAHWVLPAGLIGAAASALTGVPLVVHAHGSDVRRYALGSALAGFLARRVIARARRVLAASGELAGALAGLGARPERLAVLPMGVDGRLFFPGDRGAARRELGIDGSRPEVLFAGDLIPEKGILGLARALASSDLAVRLSAAGDGPDREALEELARADPGRLRVLGRLPPEALAARYRASDVLVLPSESEGTPVTVLEALAVGLPVVAAAVGGIPEVVRPGLEGWLSPAGAGPETFLGVLRAAIADGPGLERLRAALAAGGEDRTAARRARDLAPVLEEVARDR
jgi:glycosyltransferase involved in cell wall biosynthesis